MAGNGRNHEKKNPGSVQLTLNWQATKVLVRITPGRKPQNYYLAMDAVPSKNVDQPRTNNQ